MTDFDKSIMMLHSDEDSSTGDGDRELYSGDGYTYNNYFGSYEPYQLAWRYLGMYTSCGTGGGRRLSWYSSWKKNCQRRVMWAAYVNPNYQGYEIGEYSFYNNGEYSEKTCSAASCTPLDCHSDYSSSWTLHGIFYEASGMEDFAEQLFKHQGICVWASDSVYETMQYTRELLPYSCTQLSVKMGGRTVYMDLKPLSEGQVTIGVYADSGCSKESSYAWSDYASAYLSVYKRSSYSSYYYSSKSSSSSSGNPEDALVRYADVGTFNTYMDSYKTCQPCRAYNIAGYTYSNLQQEDEEVDHSDEGGGYNEKNGYDCYDDAGYLNCNQCFKFTTKTEMYKASSKEMSLASPTIVEIKVNGKTYGCGGVGRSSSCYADASSSSSSSSSSSGSSSSGYYYGAAAVVAFVGLLFRRKLVRTCTACKMPADMKENLNEEDAVCVM